MGPRAGLGTVEKKTIYYISRESSPGSSVVQPMVYFIMVAARILLPTTTMMMSDELLDLNVSHVVMYHPFLFSCYSWIGEYCEHNERGVYKPNIRTMRNNTGSNIYISNILWISLRCNNLFTLMCVSSYLALHVSLDYRAVMLYLILSLIMMMLYLSKIVNIK
jgi:hypothetical protein